MPYRKNNVRRTRRPPMVRRRTTYGGTRRVVRKKRFSKYRISGSSGMDRGSNSVGFPQRLFKTFTFSSEAIKLAQTVADINKSYQFRGNSIYDPDQSGVGSQPRWVDTYLGANDGTAPYQKVTVLASKITITVWQDPTLSGTVGSVAGIVAVTPYRGESSAPSNLKEIQERAFVKWVAVNNANSSRPLVLKHYAKTKAVYQGVSPIYSPDDFQHAYNANPSSQWYWAVQCVNLINGGAGTSLFSCYFTAQIKYYCLLSSLNDVAAS